MTSSIYLFPDSNVFLQCKALQEINWRSCEALAEFEEIHLLVSLPVMNEIDKLKSRGNDRLGRRARKANGIIRDLVLSDSPQRIVRPTDPTVTLAEVTSIRPTPGFLDYEIADNRILGCVDAYRSAHDDRDVRFLTHDTGPMATARNQGVPLVPVPDGWLSDPEPSVAERRAAQLEAEVKRLEQKQPRFDIQFLGTHDNKLRGQCPTARSLTDSEISHLLGQLRSRFPGSKDSEWLKDCEEMLANLHTSLQHLSERPLVEIAVENHGTVPAKDALIEIVGLGPILLCVPLDDDDSYRAYRRERIRLPSPPSLFDRRMFGSSIHLPMDYSKLPPRDPNTFYYKPNRPMEPVETITLECQQWRHETETEYFVAEIYLESERPTIEGTIECRIHAENLPNPAISHVTVQIAGQPVDVVEHAARMVAQVTPRPHGRSNDFSISPF
ncbi:MAG: PIN domain-containing protein [Chloroflexi bacterium]|nr:PIN domain-containing protein [Chloroflexota bacterium]